MQQILHPEPFNGPLHTLQVTHTLLWLWTGDLDKNDIVFLKIVDVAWTIFDIPLPRAHHKVYIQDRVMGHCQELLIGYNLIILSLPWSRGRGKNAHFSPPFGEDRFDPVGYLNFVWTTCWGLCNGISSSTTP